jgi:predicted TPR repeat methyltransferase
MVERTQALGVYDLVAQSDLSQYLQGTAQRYDLVLAADVFIYVGALEAVFAGVARVMEPGGVFCFSVESAEGQEMVLRDSLRYAHSRPYIEKLATQFGFGVSTVSQHPIREDQRVPVPGLYFWLTRR